MSESSSVQERNRELARQINEEARTNPNSPYSGKFVGIANGKIVTVSDDLDEVVRDLRLVEPDPRKTFCVEAGLDYSEGNRSSPAYQLRRSLAVSVGQQGAIQEVQHRTML